MSKLFCLAESLSQATQKVASLEAESEKQSSALNDQLTKLLNLQDQHSALQALHETAK